MEPKGISHGKFLGQPDQGIVDRNVSVGMVFAQHLSHNFGRFAVFAGIF